MYARRKRRWFATLLCCLFLAACNSGERVPSAPNAQGVASASPTAPPTEVLYISPWFRDAYPILQPYGCTTKVKVENRSCQNTADGQEVFFHHGINFKMPEGTPIFAGLDGTVVNPNSPGMLREAYGANAFRLRVTLNGQEWDVVVGQVEAAAVKPGERVKAGDQIALSGNLGNVGEPSLHLALRPAGKKYLDSVNPNDPLGIKPRG